MPGIQIPAYDIDAFEKDSPAGGFYCNTLKAHLEKHHFIFTPHKHDFYLCILFTRGTGRHEIDFRDYPVKPGTVFFLSPGQMHNWTLSADADGYIFFHTREFYDSYFNKRRIRDYGFFHSVYSAPRLLLKGKNLKKAEGSFAGLLKEYRSATPLLKSAALCSRADLIYMDLERLYTPGSESAGGNPGYSGRLKELEELIDAHYKTLKQASDYAGRMHITPKHLNRICQSCLNKTTSDIIHDRILLEAKRLLVHPGLSVNEVARELGFDDVSYFSRLFRKKTGMTPLQFAKEGRT